MSIAALRYGAAIRTRHCYNARPALATCPVLPRRNRLRASVHYELRQSPAAATAAATQARSIFAEPRCRLFSTTTDTETPQGYNKEATVLGFVQKVKIRRGNWCVLTVRLADGKKFEIVGVMPELKPGVQYEFRGQRTAYQLILDRNSIDPVQEVKDSFLNEQECLVPFLKQCPNVGAARAKLIVETFGVDTRIVILGNDNEQRLESIRGISAQAAERIIQYCQEHQDDLMDVYLQLLPLGVSERECQDVAKHLQSNDQRLEDSNPYEFLCREDSNPFDSPDPDSPKLPKISFQTADVAALHIGIVPNDRRRIEAAIYEVLREQSNITKNTTFLLDNFVQDTCNLLLSWATAQEKLVTSMLQKGDLPKVEFFELSTGDKYVQSKEFSEAERKIATFFRRSDLKIMPFPPTEESMDIAAKRCGFQQLEGSQQDAIRIVSKGPAVITGGPGTGKSSIIPALLHAMPQHRWVIVAPTGKAANNIKEKMKKTERNVTGGERDQFWCEPMTIHRLIHNDVISECDPDFVVVDEASMVDTLMLAKLISLLPPKCSLVLVGDMDQLPSIGPGSVLRDIIASKQVPVVSLELNIRQKPKSSITILANNIKQGTFALLPKSEEFEFIPILKNSDVMETLAKVIESLPENYKNDPTNYQIISPMKIGRHGTKRINNFFCGGRDEPDFRNGDKVIQTKNNYPLELINGMVGVIVNVQERQTQDDQDPDRPKISVTVDFGEEEYYEIEGDSLNDLELAHAISIHKCQGSEIPVVIVLLSKSHSVKLCNRELLYTAVTRPMHKLIIVGDEEVCKEAAKTKSSERRTLLKERLKRDIPCENEES